MCNHLSFPRRIVVSASSAKRNHFGRGVLSKEIDVEGDLFSAFAMAEYVFQRPGGGRQKIREIMSGLLSGISQWWKTGKRHSLDSDRAAISYHYDQPVDFYMPWLGESLAYSCGYFRSEADDIDSAQKNKLELICRKLRLQRCDKFLDIGCGWGSLVLHAASHHNVYAHGITISREQAAVAERRIAGARLTESCKVEVLDYRKAPGQLAAFDKIASVGMFEHVGLRNLPLYFWTARELLKPAGVFLNHGIARSYVTGNRTSLLDRVVVPFLRDVMQLGNPCRSTFIDKYVFPDGELVTLAQLLRAAESAGLEVRDVESLREHYELTLRCWVEALQRNVNTVLKQVPETTYRIWLLYMAGCATAFRRGDISIYQTVLSRPDHGNSRLPRTREDWYLSSLANQEIEA
jgi:cyclopropane-fatty-acyl-phospholipid synthase